jgi:hypothetical protein
MRHPVLSWRPTNSGSAGLFICCRRDQLVRSLHSPVSERNDLGSWATPAFRAALKYRRQLAIRVWLGRCVGLANAPPPVDVADSAHSKRMQVHICNLTSGEGKLGLSVCSSMTQYLPAPQSKLLTERDYLVLSWAPSVFCRVDLLGLLALPLTVPPPAAPQCGLIQSAEIASLRSSMILRMSAQSIAVVPIEDRSQCHRGGGSLGLPGPAANPRAEHDEGE